MSREKPESKTFCPSRPYAFAWAMADVDVRDRQGVFGARVDVRLARADRIRREREAFEQAVRIAFHHRAVHEGARVALVRVADHVLLVGRLLVGNRPLLAGGEAAAATPAEAAQFDFAAHVQRRHRAERLRERAVPAAGEILVEAGRIDDPAVGEHPSRLRREERVLVERTHAGPRLGSRLAELAERLRRKRRLREHRVQQRRHLLLGHPREAQPRPPGQLDVHQRLFDAQADAADLDDIRLDVARCEPGPDSRERLARSRTEAAGARAHEDQRARRGLAAPGAVARRNRRRARLARVAARAVRQARDQIRARTIGSVPALGTAAGKCGVAHLTFASFRSVRTRRFTTSGVAPA